MAQWTNEYTILRDLSAAQGRVPVAIERTVGARDKPPALNIAEETEEDYYRQYTGNAVEIVSTTPDLGMIQEMLCMMREAEHWSDEEDNPDKAVVVSKLNAQCPEFFPKDTETSTPNQQSPTKPTKVKQKKRQRNIAVESILQAIADKESKEVVLRKPDDFITKTVETENTTPPQGPEIQDINTTLTSKDAMGVLKGSTPSAVDKVRGWFETQTESPFPKKVNKVTLEATSIVFKKKGKVAKVEQPLKERLTASTSSKSSNSSEYKPSTLANEYYLKYVERNKFKESVKEDIWTKAENKMREIDEKRRHDAAVALSPDSGSLASGLNQSFGLSDSLSTDSFTERVMAETKIRRCVDVVGLPQHRHDLTGNCVVCDVVNKYLISPKTNSKINENNNEVLIAEAKSDNNVYKEAHDSILGLDEEITNTEDTHIGENATVSRNEDLITFDIEDLEIGEPKTDDEETLKHNKSSGLPKIVEGVATSAEEVDLDEMLPCYVESTDSANESFETFGTDDTDCDVIISI